MPPQSHLRKKMTFLGLNNSSLVSESSFLPVCITRRAQSLSHVQLFVTPAPHPATLLCPWDFPGKNTGVGCHFLLQADMAKLRGDGEKRWKQAKRWKKQKGTRNRAQEGSKNSVQNDMTNTQAEKNKKIAYFIWQSMERKACAIMKVKSLDNL